MKKISKKFIKAGSILLLAFFVVPVYSQQILSISGTNSPFHDINPVWIGNNTLLFTRAFHPKNLGGKSDPGDIWMVKREENGKWTEAVHRPDLSSKGYDLALGLEDLLTLLVLRKEEKTISVNQFSKFGQEWYFLRKINFPELNDSEGTITGRLAQKGGNLIFLALKKPGGYGNEDIYLSQKIGTIDWSPLINLGNSINGSSEETGPFFDTDSNLLFFSSSSHTGASGKDILIAKKLGESWDSWSNPEKWEQISTKGSETSITFISKDEIVWTSAQNSDGFEDLFTFTQPTSLLIPEDFKPFTGSKSIPLVVEEVLPKQITIPAEQGIKEPRPTVKEEVLPKQSSKLSEPNSAKSTPPVQEEVVPKQSSKLSVLKSKESKPPVKEEVVPKVVQQKSQVEISPVSSEPISSPVLEKTSTEQPELGVSWLVMDSNLKIEIPFEITWLKGTYTAALPQESKVSELLSAGVTTAKATANGYFPVFLPVNDLVTKGKTVVLMTKLETGSSIVLKDINFKVGTAELDGEITLNRLSEVADFLIEQPNRIIRINGHTDNVGDPTLNKELSLQRAASVRNFLISYGVNPENLRVSGWGGTKPIASNVTEAGRIKNRRVELTVEN